VGVLVGHTDGITFLDTRGDGRFILSNSKDQVQNPKYRYWYLKEQSNEIGVGY